MREPEEDRCSVFSRLSSGSASRPLWSPPSPRELRELNELRIVCATRASHASSRRRVRELPTAIGDVEEERSLPPLRNNSPSSILRLSRSPGASRRWRVRRGDDAGCLPQQPASPEQRRRWSSPSPLRSSRRRSPSSSRRFQRPLLRSPSPLPPRPHSSPLPPPRRHPQARGSPDRGCSPMRYPAPSSRCSSQRRSCSPDTRRYDGYNWKRSGSPANRRGWLSRSVERNQRSRRASPERIRGSREASPEHFGRNRRAFPEPFRGNRDAAPENFGRSRRASPERLRRSREASPEHFGRIRRASPERFGGSRTGYTGERSRPRRRQTSANPRPPRSRAPQPLDSSRGHRSSSPKPRSRSRRRSLSTAARRSRRRRDFPRERRSRSHCFRGRNRRSPTVSPERTHRKDVDADHTPSPPTTVSRYQQDAHDQQSSVVVAPGRLSLSVSARTSPSTPAASVFECPAAQPGPEADQRVKDVCLEAANLDYTAMRTSRSNAAQLKLSGTNLQHPTRTFKKVKRRAQPKEKSQQPPLTPPTIPCFEPDDLLLARPVENAAIPLSVSVVCETPVPSTETKGLTETSCKHVIETESETGMTDEITETHKTDLTDLEKLEVSVKSDDVSIEAGQPIVDAPAAMDLSDINSEEKFSLNQDVVRREEVSFNDSLNSLIAKEKSNLSTFDKHTSIHGNIHDHSNHDRPTSETQCTVICTRLDNDVNDKSFLTSEDQLSSVRNDLFSVTDSCSATAVDDSSSPGNQLLYNNVPHMTDKELTKCDSPNACEESDLNAVQYSISCEPVGLYSPKHSSVLVDLVTPPQLPVEEKSLSNDELQAISQTIDLTHSPCDELRIISIKSVESAPDALPVIDLTTSPVATSSEATSQRLPASTDLGITPIPLPNDTRAGASASPTHPPHAPLVGATDQLEGRGKKRPAQEDALGPSVTWKRPRLEHGGVHIPLADALNKLCAAGSVLIYKTGTSLNEQTDVQRSWVLSCQFPPRGLSEPPFTLVDLPFECREFQELETFFQKTCANKYFSVESIKRMENISLIHRFREKVKNLERRCENVAVVRLFHGTLKENISSICLGNLDLRLAGTSTSHTWWGAGVNFSPISYYASHYGDQGRLRSMLVCEVAVGNVCSLRQPKSGRPGEGYDTNIKLPQPQVVCKFDDDEFYPSYVIDYVVPPNHQGLKYDELLDFYGNSRYNFDESYYSTQYYGNYYNDYYD